MVRIALAIAPPQLAVRISDGVEPVNPFAERALLTARAALSEACGEHRAAADAYAQAAEGWQQFGVRPEYAYALLGQGRALAAIGAGTDAIPPLQQAREIFQAIEAAPAVSETDLLLQ